MWPSTLNMTRDECRGILRRLELESYSNVISTFRAQGGLSDVKIKILEDLRNVFHISQDRHRAEARRVANDEQLCTIAEMISGPNTTQEWSREGRRNFPLLPRIAPLTALSTVANGVAEAITIENSKLPYPSETGKFRQVEALPIDETKTNIITEDPVVVSIEEKKNLKRSLSLTDHISATIPAEKKRTISGESSQSSTQAPVHTNTQIQQLYHNHSKTQSRHKKTSFTKKPTLQAIKKTISSQSKIQNLKDSKKSDLSVLSDNPRPFAPSPKILHTYASIPQQRIIQTQSNVEMVDTFVSNSKLPQIATSKKDITNNLSKLNLQQQQQQPQQMSSQVTNPVQKFIVDERYVPGAICETIEVPYTPKNQTMAASSFQGSRSIVKTTSIPLGTSNKQPYKLKISTASDVQKNPQTHVLTVVDSATMSAESFSGTKHLPHPSSIGISSCNIENDINSTKAIIADNLRGNSVELVTTPGVETKKLTCGISLASPLGQSTLKSAVHPIATKPKIQITGQQILNPIISDVKLPIGVQLKGNACRKNLKIFPAQSGKMFIQSIDSSKTAITKLGTVVSQKNLNFSSMASSPNATTTSTIAPGSRISVQKVQILPSTSLSRQVTAGKPNVIFMQTSSMGNTSPMTPSSASTISESNSSSTLIKTIPVARATRISAGTEKNITDLQFTPVPSKAVQNNVYVIGAIPSENAVKDQNESNLIGNNNMITEDTPVDIVTTPIMTNVDNSSINHISKGAESFEVKYALPINTIGNNSSNESNSNRVSITSAYQNVTQQALIKNSRVPESTDGIIAKKSKQAAITGKSKVYQGCVNEYISSETDWEMELDQEVANNNKRREINHSLEDYESRNSKNDDNHNEVIQEISSVNTALSEDNFNEVIEEETIDEDNLSQQENTTDMEEEVDYVSYGSGNEMDENMTIEYIDEMENCIDDENRSTSSSYKEVKEFAYTSQEQMNSPNNNIENRNSSTAKLTMKHNNHHKSSYNKISYELNEKTGFKSYSTSQVKQSTGENGQGIACEMTTEELESALSGSSIEKFNNISK